MLPFPIKLGSDTQELTRSVRYCSFQRVFKEMGIEFLFEGVTAVRLRFT